MKPARSETIEIRSKFSIENIIRGQKFLGLIDKMQMLKTDSILK